MGSNVAFLKIYLFILYKHDLQNKWEWGKYD